MTRPLEDGVRELLGALVEDVGVREVRARIRAGSAELFITRRGRRERLVADAPAIALDHATRLDLDGLEVVAAPRGDEVRLYARRRDAPPDALAALVEEGALPPGIDEAILATALAGHGLLAVGPARALRRRVVRAVASAAGEAAHLVSLDDDDGPLRARAERALTLGAELLCVEADPGELRRASRPPLDAAWIASVRAPSAEALFAALGGEPIGSHVCVFGYTPDGAARLVERHAPEGATGPAPEPPRAEAPRPPVSWAPTEAQPPILDAPPPDALPPLPPLAEAPPADWGAPDDGPGWELGSTPPTAAPSTGFERALADVKSRPQFVPRPPSPHPQARELQSQEGDAVDPLGGLTLEPPGGAPEREDEP